MKKGPRFTIYATSLQTGVSVRFSRPYLADYNLGKVESPHIQLAKAVAASSAFPPIMAPSCSGSSPPIGKTGLKEWDKKDNIRGKKKLPQDHGPYRRGRLRQPRAGTGLGPLHHGAGERRGGAVFGDDRVILARAERLFNHQAGYQHRRRTDPPPAQEMAIATRGEEGVGQILGHNHQDWPLERGGKGTRVPAPAAQGQQGDGEVGRIGTRLKSFSEKEQETVNQLGLRPHRRRHAPLGAGAGSQTGAFALPQIVRASPKKKEGAFAPSLLYRVS